MPHNTRKGFTIIIRLSMFIDRAQARDLAFVVPILWTKIQRIEGFLYNYSGAHILY